MRIICFPVAGALAFLSACGGGGQNPYRSAALEPMSGDGVQTDPNAGQRPPATSPQVPGSGNVQVDPNNKPPVIEPVSSKQAVYNTALAIGVFASDPDFDVLTYEFETVGDVLPKTQSSTGMFSIPVPATIGSGTAMGIVKVSDGKGATSNRTFQIFIQGAPSASPLKQAFAASCDTLTDALQKQVCQTLGSIVR